MSLRRRLDRLGPPADPPLLLVIFDAPEKTGADVEPVYKPPTLADAGDQFEARCAAAVGAYAIAHRET